MSSDQKILVIQDNLADGNIVQLLQDHRQEMLKHSPPENVHALDVGQLNASDITFWSAWLHRDAVQNEVVWDDAREMEFAGCGALKDLGGEHGELKSMKTRPEHLRKGVAQTLLSFILQQAEVSGFKRLSLETGTQAVFHPAHALYRRNGFEICEPFADYAAVPTSVCMTKLW